MAWETRGNNRYYYKKRRIGRKVVSSYAGTGPMVEEMVLHEDRRRELIKTNRQEAGLMEQQITKASQLTKYITEGVLLVSGFHKHKGQWRRKRHVKK